jgi:hypothetical protein
MAVVAAVAASSCLLPMLLLCLRYDDVVTYDLACGCGGLILGL